MAIGKSVAWTIMDRVIGNGIIENIADVTNCENDTHKSYNNGCSEKCNIPSIVDLAIRKKANTSDVNAGRYISCTIDVVKIGLYGTSSIDVNYDLCEFLEFEIFTASSSDIPYGSVRASLLLAICLLVNISY